jgi:hypothetical protein
MGGRRVLVLAFLLNLLDVATALAHWHGNLPVTRFCLGMFLGWSAGALLVSVGIGVECVSKKALDRPA